MQMLPAEKWGAVVSNYAEFIAATRTTPINCGSSRRPAWPLRHRPEFLLGYHYGYLGYPKHATTELDKAIKLAPQDQASQKLRERDGREMRCSAIDE